MRCCHEHVNIGLGWFSYGSDVGGAVPRLKDTSKPQRALKVVNKPVDSDTVLIASGCYAELVK
jgi:hypothetical protein